jgi:hypothetical protein
MKVFTFINRRNGWRIFPLVSCLLASFFLNTPVSKAQNGKILVTDNTQKNFLKAYKLIFDLADNDYRSTSNTMDATLFPKFGEYSPYWILSGSDKGNFVIPDTISPNYTTVVTKNYSNYVWQTEEHRSIQFKKTTRKVAVFRSKVETGGYSINWEVQYFKSLFETFLYKEIYYFINEDDLTKGNIPDSTDMLIIPAFTVHSKGEKFYIDSIYQFAPSLKNRIDNFLSKGKLIYTEGNAVYFMQKAGYLGSDAVNFDDKLSDKSNFRGR